MHRVDDPKPNLIDRAIGLVSPERALRRAVARESARNIDRMFRNSHRSGVSTRVDAKWASYAAGAMGSRLSSSTQRGLRNRAQQLDRENALFSSLLNRSVDFCVGKGFSVQSLTEDEEWNQKAEELWRSYWERPEISGLTGLEVDRHAWREWKRDGEAGAILLGDGRIQLIEAGQLRTPNGKHIDGRFFDGVEVNDAYRPVRFHIATADNKTVAVDEANFLFIRNLKQRTDVRGTPALASSFPLFDQIDGYVEAAIIAARMAACYGIIRQLASPNSFMQGLPTAKNSAGYDVPQITLEPGLFEYSATGEHIHQIDPKQPGPQFQSLVQTLIGMASLEMGFPREVAVLDFSTSNYSRAKAALNQAQRTAEPQQQTFIQRFRSRLYRWRVSKWMKEGQLPTREDAWKHRVIPDPWPFIDPRYDIAGMLAEVDAGLKTEGDQILARGGDPADVRRRRAFEIGEKKRLGIPVMRSNMTAPVEDAPQNTTTEQEDDDEADD